MVPVFLLVLSCGRDPAVTPPDDTTGRETGQPVESVPPADTADSVETGETAGPWAPWNGEGAYRVILEVPPVETGDDGVDEGPARILLHLSEALAALGLAGPGDPGTIQVVRESAEGEPLAPSLLPVGARGPYDVPFRFTDQDLWDLDYVYDPATASDAGNLTFVHRQEGDGETRYAVYFDLAPKGGAAPASPRRPALGDFDLRFQPEGHLGSMIHSRPYPVDLDQDGVLDIVMGDSLGTVTLYPGQGTAEAPTWDAWVWLETTEGGPIQKNYLAVPEVADWDGDGDLDLLVGSEYGAVVTFYANTGSAGIPVFEPGRELAADGSVLELPASPCPEAPFYTADYTASPETADWDGDGDLDLLAGGYVTGRIYLFENVLDGPGEPVLVSRGPIEADGDVINTWWAASPVLVDLDDDGDLDLLSGTFNWEPTPEEILWWPPFFAWENTAGPGVEPVFTSLELDWAAPDNVGAAAITNLRAADLDSDGDPDLMEAAEGYVWIFRNVGDAANPLLQPEDPLPQSWVPQATPSDGQPVDLDGDGDLDLVGGGGSEVPWQENLGDADPPTWVTHGGLTADGSLIHYEYEHGDDTSFPVFHDWDADGDLDLVLGRADGKVFLYRNPGGRPIDGLEAGAPLTLESGDSLHVGAGLDPKGSFEGHSGDRAQPAPADLDADGDTDLIVGDATGAVTLFENTGGDAAPVFAEGVKIIAGSDTRAAISVADWDGDGDVDLILGLGSRVAIYENVGDSGTFVLGPATEVDHPTINYPHPYAADLNGDGDLDLSISSSYGYTYVAERTFLEAGWLDADAVRVEARSGQTVDWEVEDSIAWSYEADVLPEHADPEWTPFASSGSVYGGVLTLGPEESFYLGDLWSDAGAPEWTGAPGTEVEIRLRVRSLVAGQVDTVDLAVSDGDRNWHLRWDPSGISFYGYADRWPTLTTDWRTWRLAMQGDVVEVCVDDGAEATWTSPASFHYARNALWVGDDGTGTGGETQVDWIRWTLAGDGDPCTGW